MFRKLILSTAISIFSFSALAQDQSLELKPGYKQILCAPADRLHQALIKEMSMMNISLVGLENQSDTNLVTLIYKNEERYTVVSINRASNIGCLVINGYLSKPSEEHETGKVLGEMSH
jgi:hypothetical protein